MMVFLCSPSSAITVHLASDMSVYVTREPVKFSVTLTNESSSVQYFAGVDALDSNMDYFYYEIVNPQGTLEYRKFRHRSSNEAWNYGLFWGEPLNPGESVLFFSYPNFTYCLNPHAEKYSRGNCTKITFSVSGTYKVRLIYSVPSKFVNLWRGANGEAISNQIELSFRPEGAQEKEILDALWSAGGDLSTGDDGLLISFDKYKLSKALKDCPDNPLIKHVYFDLARQILCDGPRSDAPRARDLLLHCRKACPDYRTEEISTHLAYAYYNMNQTDAARTEMISAMRRNHLLKTNYPFMWLKIIIDYGNVEAVGRWREKRAKNEYRVEEEIQ